MKRSGPERRRNRSSIRKRAIELQLEATAECSRYNSLVLADEMGLVVAAAGDQEQAERLAAFSPHLAAGRSVWQGEVHTTEESMEVSVAPLDIEYGSLYLAAAGGCRPETLQDLAHTSQGVLRILS